MSTQMDRAYDWDEAIENDSSFITLPEGDYDFEVLKVEKAHHGGSEKLPACPKAVIHIGIDTPEGQASIRHNLFLHSRTEGKLCAFFAGIGERKNGEKYPMNWSRVTGSRGRCRVGTREYNGSTFNEIKKFYSDGIAGQARNDGAEEPISNVYTPGKF